MREVTLAVLDGKVLVIKDEGSTDRDPVEPLSVEGGTVVKLSYNSADQLARKLLNATGASVVFSRGTTKSDLDTGR